MQVKHIGDESVLEAAKNNLVVISVVRAKLRKGNTVEAILEKVTSAAAVAAKSRQSCSTLCDPIVSSP